MATYPNEGARLLAAAMALRGETQSATARSLGVTPSLLSRWLRTGEHARKPGRAHAGRIQAGYGVPPGAWDEAPRRKAA